MILSKFFTAFGIICLVIAVILLWQRNNPKRIAFKSTQTLSKKINTGKKVLPARIIVESAKIDLQIIPAKVFGQKWETTSLGVSWLDISSVPGEKGNSVIYGHNWTNLLGKMISVRPGDEIRIIFTDGSIKKFVVNNTVMVSPDNVSVLNQTDSETLTVYTCAGLFDEKRFVVVASLI